MAVSNPATTDFRVVKSAEILCRSGYEVHVVGLLNTGCEPYQQVNGVHYHRVKLLTGFRCLAAGMGFGPGRKPKPPKPRASKSKPSRASSENRLRVLSFLVLPVVYLLAAVLSLLLVLVFLLLLSVGLLKSGIQWFARAIGLGTDQTVTFASRLTWCLCTVESLPYRAGKALSEASALGRQFALTGVNRWLFRAGNALSSTQQQVRDQLHETGIITVLNRKGRFLRSFYHKLVELDGDAYHAHELWPLQACVRAAKKSGARIVYDSHELEAHRNAHYTPLQRRLWTSHERRTIRKVDEVVTVSEGCAGELQRLYGLQAVTVVHNMPLFRQDPVSCGLRERFELGQDMRIAVYVGSVTFNRGLEQLLAAVEQLPQFALITVGRWREDIRQQLLEKTQSNGMAERFFMHPAVPPTQVPRLISEADVSVLPIQNACLSYYYCMPNKLFESTVAGVPIVASDFPDMRKFIQENNIGVVCDPTNPDAIAQAILEVSDSRHRYYNPIKLQRLRQQCCFEEGGKKLVALYERLLGSARQVLGATPSYVDQA